jgi:integrase
VALIESTKDGRPQYRVRWGYYRDDAGKLRYQERRFRNKTEARRFDRENKTGTTLDSERITVATLFALWRDAHTMEWQLRTRRDYATQFKRRIGPHLGRKRVSTLTPAVITEWQNQMVMESSARAANKSLQALKTMIRWGRSKGYCTNRMVDDTRDLKTPKPKPANPYTPEQVEQIAKGCRNLLDATMIRLAAYSGLRWSECRALRWSDVDFDTETINLRFSADADGTIKATKSDKHRLVPVLAPGIKALKQWREHAPDCDEIFPTRNGRPITPKDWWVRMGKVREACGIHFDFHELRDTYASILIQTTGIGEAELTMWLGHRSIQTTLDNYGQLFAKRKASVAALANQALARGDF